VAPDRGRGLVGHRVSEVLADEDVALVTDVEEVHRGLADEAGDEDVGRFVVTLHRRADLLETAAVEDGDAVGHRHRLRLVVRDVDGRRVQVLLELLELRAHLRAQLRVQVRQRLVEQEHLRVADDGPPERDALLLATGELAGLAVEQVGDAEDVGGLVDALGDLPRRRSVDSSGPNAMFPRTVMWGYRA